MNNRKISVNKVCKLNRETIRSNNQPDYINYLDTGNVTRNKIDEIKKLVNGIDKYPSRAQRKVQKNTIIYSTVRPEQEHFGIIENPIDNLIVSTGFTTLDVIDDTIDAKYLYYSLTNKSITAYLNVIATNNVTSYPSLNPSDIGDIVLKIPSSKTEQQKIAKVLSDLDAKIELNNKINTELEAMAKKLYDYWFVQFDFPDTNAKPYKTTGGKMVWNEELKREIPEGWDVKKIKKILKTELGGTPSTAIEEFWEGDIPWLNSGEIANFPIINSEASISKKAIENSATSLMPKGTIVLSITRHIRPSILAIDACANQSVVGIYQSDKIKLSYLYPFIQNEVPRYMTLRTGAQQPHINKQTIDTTFIIIPNDKVLDEYYKKADVIYDKIINNAFQNQELASLRDWLLPMLMNGQVSVGEVAKDYDVNEDVLGMVAEAETKDTFTEIMNQLNFDYEIAAIALLTFNRFKHNYGKKYMHKMFSNIELLNTLPVFKELTFEEKGWGMFSPQIRKAIDNQKFIEFEELNNTQKVIKVNIKHLIEVSTWIKKEENHEFVKQVNNMLSIYENPIINKKMDSIELFNTVLECMKALKTDEFKLIYTKMENWPMEEEGYATKADKFNSTATQHMISFIKEINN